MKSKRASKETSTRISCIATVMKANTHKTLISNFETTNTCRAVSVIPVPFASSVIRVVTEWQE